MGPALVAIGVCACNTILDNRPGELRRSTTPADATSDPGPQIAYGDRADAGPTTTEASPPRSCAAGETLCRDGCVRTDDPLYGCGAPSCSPCETARAVSMCVANECVIDRCDPGYADCNGIPSDGCEADLSRALSCGACDRACSPDTPICAPTDAGFQCTTGCSPDTPVRCGDECVSPLTDVRHCGGCNMKCPDLPQATAKCAAGGCEFACKTGFADCNMDPRDGCESNIASDRLHCGACGRSCGGGVCVRGACEAPRDGG